MVQALLKEEATRAQQAQGQPNKSSNTAQSALNQNQFWTVAGAGGGDGERRTEAARSYHSAQAQIISSGGYYSDDGFAPDQPVQRSNEDKDKDEDEDEGEGEGEGLGRAKEAAAAEGGVGGGLEGRHPGDFAFVHSEPSPVESQPVPRPPSPGAHAREQAQELAQRAQAFAEEQAQVLTQQEQEVTPTLPPAPPSEETGAEAGSGGGGGASPKPTLAPMPTLASTERRQSGELFDHPAFRKAAAKWVQVHEEAEDDFEHEHPHARVSQFSQATRFGRCATTVRAA